MVEYSRLAQVRGLREQGYHSDAETALLEAAEYQKMVCGSPTYLRGPDGRIYACVGNKETPLDGAYDHYVEALGYRTVVYRDGICLGDMA